MDGNCNKLNIYVIGNSEIFYKWVFNMNSDDCLNYNLFFGYDIKNIESEINKIDLIIIVSENVSAADICRKCRKLVDFPIIAIGAEKESLVLALFEAGADDYIKIPVSKKVFETLVFTHLRREERCIKKHDIGL